jgi:hypothetical protein
VMPSVALLCSEAAVGKQVPKRHKPHTPVSGVGRYLKLGRSIGARRASSAAWVLTGSSPQERLRWWCVCGHVFLWRASYRYRRRAVIALPLRLFVGRGCGASVTTPGYSALSHTPPRCVLVDAPILPCLRGGSQKYSHNLPRADNLSARGLPLVVRACGRRSVCTCETNSDEDVEHLPILT